MKTVWITRSLVEAEQIKSATCPKKGVIEERPASQFYSEVGTLWVVKAPHPNWKRHPYPNLYS